MKLVLNVGHVSIFYFIYEVSIELNSFFTETGSGAQKSVFRM